jgi:membrane protein YdbS with pleckstrin-like domain
VAYSDLMLRDNETLVLDLHPHWWYFAKALLAVVLALALAVLVLVEDWWDFTKFGAAILVLAALVWLAERYAHWASTYFILTSDRIIYREGIFAKHGMEIPLARINSIFFNQRIIERILGLGDLKVESASKTGAEVFDDIRRPERVQHEIYSQMEALENRGFDRIGQQITQAQGQGQGQPPMSPPPGPPTMAATPPAPGPPPPRSTPPSPPPPAPAGAAASVADRIADLHRLHTQGAITDAEFEAKKAQLLDQL